MSYQVLARKWRPRTFREMVGQEHVLQALINALDHDRLHHAYLFTGTRGVGKTTIARILAKCLNCEVGVSSVPCNECSACTEINEGRFIDLIEVDAASRTKVEDTRELLENVQYAPTRGRYKVYLIDEVHMLSNSSFNALLKTLEEPPPHVKFLLATTDPQKLPVTILSRCLQFNLKNMTPERIVAHLQFVLEKEVVPFDESGLWQLARSADGSMRDALSLTDQSIAFGDGKITDADVRTMLGTIDQTLVYDVLSALIAEDAALLLSAVADLAEHSPDYSAALAELIATLHRVAIAQVLPEAVDNSQGDRQQIYTFAQAISAEDIQLYYQTALLGRRDLPLVPDPRSGFEMVLLRMLAFKPQGVNHLPAASVASQSSGNVNNVPQGIAQKSEQKTHKLEESIAEGEAVDTGKKSSAADESAESINATSAVSELSLSSSLALVGDSEENDSQENDDLDIDIPEVDEQVMADALAEYHRQHSAIDDEENQRNPANDEPTHAGPVVDQVQSDSVPLGKVSLTKINWSELNEETWFTVYTGIQTGGLLQSTVANCQLIDKQADQVEFRLDERQSTLYDVKHQQYLAELLSEYFAQAIQVIITIGEVSAKTPAQIIVRRQQERQQQAKIAIENDPVVQQLQAIFDATIVGDSVRPVN
jgi:DNA polymerase III subunit gamma/tau